MIKFTKAQMMDEFREIVYQYARSASFCLAPESGYRLLFQREPENPEDVYYFMDPQVFSHTCEDSFTIDQFQATGTVEQFYDYGLLGIRNIHPVESGGANEWTFAYGMIWDVSRSFLIRESCNGEPVRAAKCLYAAKAFFARLVLDGCDRTSLDGDEDAPNDMLSLSEIAILSGLDERTVRNATSKNAANRLETAIVNSNIYIPREAALTWLSTKRGYTPTRIGENLPANVVLNEEFFSPEEAGDYICKIRKRMGISQKELVKQAELSVDAQWLKQLEQGEIPSDEKNLETLGNFLGLNGLLFALRLIEVKKKYEFHDLRRRIYRASND